VKTPFIITLVLMCALSGCASFDKGAFIGLIESVVRSSIEYLREHPESIMASMPIDAMVSDDASVSDVSSDRE